MLHAMILLNCLKYQLESVNVPSMKSSAELCAVVQVQSIIEAL